LSKDPEALVTGSHSGYQMINLLTLLGVSRIVLLGYDGQTGPGNKKHWFGDHPIPTPHTVFDIMVAKYRLMVKPLQDLGVEVLNASPGSAIDAFPKVALESILSD
jgi:hypothetical protein